MTFSRLLIVLTLFLFLYACKTPQSQSTQSSNAKDSLALVNNTEQVVALDTPFWVSVGGPYQPSRNQALRILHTSISLEPHWETSEITASCDLFLTPYFYNQDTIFLDARGFLIHGVYDVYTGKKEPLAYTYDQKKIAISYGRTITKKDTLHVRVEYTARPKEIMKLGHPSGAPEEGVYFINPKGTNPFKPKQIWTQGETENNSCWFPTIDAPNVKTTQEVFITVDDQYQTLSNGKWVSSTKLEGGKRMDHWKQDLPHAPYLFMFAVGEFAIIKDSYKGKDVHYYVEKEFEPHARAIFGKTPQMMAFFEDIFGMKYPWDKYHQIVVRDYISGAMENTSASVFMEGLLVDSIAIKDQSWEGIISHELAHQWFGNVVTCESWSNLTLNEAFASYSEVLWSEHAYGKEEAIFQLRSEKEDYLYEAQGLKESTIRYHYQDREEMFDSHSYSKGCLTLHMLRKTIGDEAFFSGVKKYLKDNAFKPVEIHHLRLAFEEVTGLDLLSFFEQWFLKPGHPELDVTHWFEKDSLYIKVNQKQDLRFIPLYELSIPLKISEEGVWTSKMLEVSKKEEIFKFPMKKQAECVTVDPEGYLLAVIQHTKAVSEWVHQFQYAEETSARMTAIQMLNGFVLSDENARKAMRAGLKDPFWAIRMECMRTFYQYMGEGKEDIRLEIEQIGIKDSKALVRAAAMDVLPGLGTPSEYFNDRFSDESYFVKSNCIYAMSELLVEEAAPKFKELELLEERHVVYALADYYGYFGIEGKYEWFVKQLDRTSGSELSYLMNHFTQYVLNQNEEIQARGVAYLENIARHNSFYQSRKDAFQMLIVLGSKLSWIDEKLEDIMKYEKDKRVVEFHQALK